MIYLRLRDLREDEDLVQTKLADRYATSVDYLLGRADVREPYPKSKRPALIAKKRPLL
ncbi:MAG: hypothetical protein RSJ41_06340 [Clostridia bacterium]